MASPIEKRRQYLIAFGKQQQSPCPSMPSFEGRKKMKRTLRKIWVCNDVWMDIFPHFDHAELGLKLALISPRFNALVDAHFDGKSELTIWRHILIEEDTDAEMPVFINFVNPVGFPLPDHSLPNKIRFKDLRIEYIDHSVLSFLRSNKHIWDGGIKLDLSMCADGPWDVFAHEIWPIFASNIRHLQFPDGYHFVRLFRRISHTILTGLNISTINSGRLALDIFGDNGPIATAEKALSKWLHTPSKDGQPKRLFWEDYFGWRTKEWESKLRKEFLSATTTNFSVNYCIRFKTQNPPPIMPFELVNERTNEKLTLEQKSSAVNCWLLKRCPISEKAADQWEDENLDDLNDVSIDLNDHNFIGPLSPPPAAAEEDEAGQSN